MFANVRLLVSRGAVKGDPESCSAYRLYGHTCGEFCRCVIGNVILSDDAFAGMNAHLAFRQCVGKRLGLELIVESC
jgi:hypothetical protein